MKLTPKEHVLYDAIHKLRDEDCEELARSIGQVDAGVARFQPDTESANTGGVVGPHTFYALPSRMLITGCSRPGPRRSRAPCSSTRYASRLSADLATRRRPAPDDGAGGRARGDRVSRSCAKHATQQATYRAAVRETLNLSDDVAVSVTGPRGTFPTEVPSALAEPLGTVGGAVKPTDEVF